MGQIESSSTYKRTLRAGIIVGVVGILSMLFTNLFAQTFGTVSFDGTTAFYVILTQMHLLAAVGCLPFSATLISAALVMRHLDAVTVRAIPPAEQQSGAKPAG
jgi:hypothetical protein